MVAHVDGAGDVARTDAVADLANDGRAITKLVYCGAVGSLPTAQIADFPGTSTSFPSGSLQITPSEKRVNLDENFKICNSWTFESEGNDRV